MRHNAVLAEELEHEHELINTGEKSDFKPLPVEKMQALILEHREHGKRLAWSFLSTWRIRMKQDEVISVVGAALCEAASRFDDTRGVNFKTFFFYHLRGMLLKEISRMINDQRMFQLYPYSMLTDSQTSEGFSYYHQPIVPVEHNNPERILEKREIAKICWDACSTLDPLEQEVLIRHFVNDEPLINIAESLDYCRCHISRVKSRGLAKLRKLLKRSVQADKQKTILNEHLESAHPNLLKGRAYTGGRGRRKNEKIANFKTRKAA